MEANASGPENVLDSTTNGEVISTTTTVDDAPVKRGRGRPRKKSGTTEEEALSGETPNTTPARRGKNTTGRIKKPYVPTGRPRGRPRKHIPLEPPVETTEVMEEDEVVEGEGPETEPKPASDTVPAKEGGTTYSRAEAVEAACNRALEVNDTDSRYAKAQSIEDL